jgi:hypothetical protein
LTSDGFAGVEPETETAADILLANKERRAQATVWDGDLVTKQINGLALFCCLGTGLLFGCPSRKQSWPNILITGFFLPGKHG